MSSPIVVGKQKCSVGRVVSTLSVLFNDTVNGAMLELY